MASERSDNEAAYLRRYARHCTPWYIVPQKMGEMIKCARRKEREMNLIKDIVGRGRWCATENMAGLLSLSVG